MDSSDQQLLERFAATNDEAAFEQLVQRYGPMVMGVSSRILQDSHEASDIFQAVFLVLSQKASSLMKKPSIGGWIYRVASNASLNAKRDRVIRVKHHQALETEVNLHTKEENQWEEIRPILDEELNRLPEKYRNPIVLCYLEGLNYEEAALQLGFSHSTLKMRLERARYLLRDRFTRRGLILSGTVLTTYLTQNASAQVATDIVATTVKAATTQIAGTQIISNQVLITMKGIMKSLLIQKLKMAMLICLSMTAIGGGGLVAYENLIKASNPSLTSNDLVSTETASVGLSSTEQIKIALQQFYDAESKIYLPTRMIVIPDDCKSDPGSPVSVTKTIDKITFDGDHATVLVSDRTSCKAIRTRTGKAVLIEHVSVTKEEWHRNDQGKWDRGLITPASSTSFENGKPRP
jgi:RNA polymerase sigma factor (sigma-70 family)